MYNCSRCGRMIDNDWHPGEQDPDEEFGLMCPSCAEDLICPDCGEIAQWVEESFDYGGTHCTNGKDGTHHTGTYVTKCCGAQQ